jgi:uncharacterized protein YjbI with pentapeptide repeats/CHAT domain-containing protein
MVRNNLGYDFSNQNLQGKNFKGDNLQDCKFIKSDLTGADFTDARLERANLAGANLTGAILAGANLKDAILINTNLEKANLKGTNLANANLTNANLANTKLGLKEQWENSLLIMSLNSVVLLVILLEICGIRVGGNIFPTRLNFYPEPTWENLYICGTIVVINAVFTFYISQGLKKAFYNAFIVGVIAVILSSIHALNNFVIGIIFRDTLQSTGGRLIRFVLRTAFASITAFGIDVLAVLVAVAIVLTVILWKNKARHITVFISLFITIPTGIILYLLNGNSASSIFGISIAIFTILLGQFIASKTLKGDKVYTLVHDSAVIIASISGTNFDHAILTDASFTKAELQGANFIDAKLTRTFWFKAEEMNLARFSNYSYLSKSEIQKLVCTGEAENEIFDSKDLKEINLRGANLKNTSFCGIDLSDANLEGVELQGANLARTNLENTILNKACLTGVCIENWGLKQTTKIEDIKCDYVFMQDDERQRMPKNGKFTKNQFQSFVLSLNEFYRYNSHVQADIGKFLIHIFPIIINCSNPKDITVLILIKSSFGEETYIKSLPLLGDNVGHDWHETLIEVVTATISSLNSNGLSLPKIQNLEKIIKHQILDNNQSSLHPNYLQHIGQFLYSYLFAESSNEPNKFSTLLSEAISEAKSQAKILHIQLVFPKYISQSIRLADYPWELLHDNNSFILLNQDVTLSRYILIEDAPPNLPKFDKLHVLSILSNTYNTEIGIEKLPRKQWEEINQVMEKAKEEGYINLTQLNPTVEELEKFLKLHRNKNERYVLHFYGHGVFGGECKINNSIFHPYNTETNKICDWCKNDFPKPQGYLLFEKEGEVDYVSAKSLEFLLQPQNNSHEQLSKVVLVMLSACESAMAGNNLFRGTAQNLISRRIPAVVAMQYTVDATYATKFVEKFYQLLGSKNSEGLPNSLEVAMSLARQGVDFNNKQWYRPVLYLRDRSHE